MKIAKSYREFNKILRKYTKRQKTNPYYWCPWVSYTIKTPEQIEQIKHTKLYKTSVNLPIIIKEFENNYNEICWFDSYEFGYLNGIEITNEDFYYVYTKLNGETGYLSCVGGFNRDLDKVEEFLINKYPKEEIQELLILINNIKQRESNN